MEESKIIDLLKRDDQAALKVIFDSYHVSLCIVAYNVVNDKDQAKDIVQDVFIKIWKNRHELKINISLKAYLKRAVINTSLNHLEHIARFKKQSLEHVNLNIHSYNAVDNSILLDELTIKADHALNKLPPRTRAVFSLIRTNGMSYKEVSETLNISMKAVEKEMMKALRLLRVALKEYLHVLVFIFMKIYFAIL